MRIPSASVAALLLAATSAQAGPVSGWGALGRLVGTSWGSAVEAFDVRWKVPGEIMLMTTVAGSQTAAIEYRLQTDGAILAYYMNNAIGRIDLPTADSWQQSTLSGDFSYQCRIRSSILNCEHAGSGGRVPFTMQRLGGADFAARLAAIDAKATRPSQEQVWRRGLVKEWGPFASLLRWNGTSFHTEERFYAAFVGDRPVANVQLAWQKDADGNLYLVEAWQTERSAAGYDWKQKDGTLVRGWHGTKEAVPFAIAGEDRIEGKSRAPRAQKMLPVEYVATDDGFIVTYFETGGGARQDVERYVLKSIDTDTMKQWRAQNEAAREERARAERQAKAERRSGFLDALNLVTQGAAAAVGSYNNAYHGGSIPSGPGGMENPLDPNSSQNVAFRQNLQALGDRIAVDAASRQEGAGVVPRSSAMRGGGPNASPTPAGVVPPVSVPAVPASSSAKVGPGRTVAYALWIGKDWKEGDTGNGVCFSPVITRQFDTWPDGNPETILYDLAASDFAALERGCRAAGEIPRSAERGYETGFDADTSRAQDRVNALRTKSYNTEVSIR